MHCARGREPDHTATRATSAFLRIPAATTRALIPRLVTEVVRLWSVALATRCVDFVLSQSLGCPVASTATVGGTRRGTIPTLEPFAEPPIVLATVPASLDVTLLNLDLVGTEADPWALDFGLRHSQFTEGKHVDVPFVHYILGHVPWVPCEVTVCAG